MESSRRSGHNTGATGRGPQLVHSRGRGTQRLKEPSSGPAQKPALIFIAATLCLFGPELANLHPNDDQTWKLYLTAKEAANIVFCLCLAWLLKGRIRIMMMSLSVVFLTQAIHEAMGVNEFKGQQYEYPAEFVFLLLMWWVAKPYRSDHE